MSILYLLIPIAGLFVILAIAIFFWAVRSNQFEDLERQGMNVLLDDDDTKPKPPQSAKPSNHNDNH